jgi:hypothetical protein
MGGRFRVVHALTMPALSRPAPQSGIENDVLSSRDESCTEAEESTEGGPELLPLLSSTAADT